MSIYSISNFVENHSQKVDVIEPFQLENDNLLKIDLDGEVWTKMGSMVAYKGNISFKREGVLEQGLGRLMKKSLTGEGTQLTKASGRGDLFLADSGKKVSILHLEDEAIFVNGNDILAFDHSINWDIKMMKKVAGLLSGGLFNIKLEGKGYIAITTFYKPLTLKVTRGMPVVTDPNATVAWSASLSPEIKTDVSLGTFFGR
ncbi:MAG TPA: AIM24 family protein, partial [Bacillota bacterium]|nr:AIM24 family protein [Bacillota bacterium]